MTENNQDYQQLMKMTEFEILGGELSPQFSAFFLGNHTLFVVLWSDYKWPRVPSFKL